ncbi:adenosylcobinamide-GDP ribazoletransferase [Haloarcula onubensis]|uniref:Adenosylcobinamide-GDP ribazoletransferase n=1 Tax=Haloarcula onubensis TaxID=2950539 RepID=A0ABU2FJK5_9EURY|nr:adenosylcobinamide-GDP ribazoletransferase [Halomicroarcula sp. S3CR25-11]MDS0280934.1 adenosylcobinamide-GDP ribazoletransferase [Halomicroarcula sp. S3CR25-11]
MVLSALRGALGFLSRLPVGGGEDAWTAFTATPAAFPLAGYVVGGLVALPFLAAALPGPVVAAAALVSLVAVTGVNHADGLADLGDAAAVHGAPAERREVMRDTTVGVGAVLALGTVLVALALGLLAATTLPALVAVAAVVASEVGAKTAMAALACLGDPSHEGFGATMLDGNGPVDLVVALAAALPIALVAVPVTAVALLAALAVALLVRRWATRTVGGVGGDVFGATNELARVVALHAAVAAWHLGGPAWTLW